VVPEGTFVRTNRLGSNGPEITRTGFGAWAIGGPWKVGWGPVDDDESVAAIRHAVESGANWVDTAAVYGLGHSEEVVRRALEPYNVHDEVLVFTKCGVNWYDDGEPKRTLHPEGIRFECEQSLKRLGVDTIDLYQFHWPDEVSGTPVEESWGVMKELVDEGKVRWAGVSNFTVELLERCEPIMHVDSLQPPLSLVVRDAREDVIPWAADNGTGVIVYSPMASGLLTGKFSAEHVEGLAEDDWRRRAARFQEPQLSRNLALVEQLRPIAERLDVSVPTLAVAWTLAVPGVTAAIVGARRPDQVDGWVAAADLELDADTMAEIERAVVDTGAGA
jgi:aryl-alcohol dehydrogenase-like predicted oxidoreductase